MAFSATSSRRGARDEGTIKWLRNVRRGFAHHARKAEDGEYEARAALKRARDHLVYVCAYKTSGEALEAESAMRVTRLHLENVRDRFEYVQIKRRRLDEDGVVMQRDKEDFHLDAAGRALNEMLILEEREQAALEQGAEAGLGRDADADALVVRARALQTYARGLTLLMPKASAMSMLRPRGRVAPLQGDGGGAALATPAPIEAAAPNDAVELRVPIEAGKATLAPADAAPAHADADRGTAAVALASADADLAIALSVAASAHADAASSTWRPRCAKSDPPSRSMKR